MTTIIVYSGTQSTTITTTDSLNTYNTYNTAYPITVRIIRDNDNYTGASSEMYWLNEYSSINSAPQRKKKHKGQKYKPTALDRLNQSKQAKKR